MNLYNKRYGSLFFILITLYFSQVYKQKTEVAKKEYLKALAAYRASLVSKVINQFDIISLSNQLCSIIVMLFPSTE